MNNEKNFPAQYPSKRKKHKIFLIKHKYTHIFISNLPLRLAFMHVVREHVQSKYYLSSKCADIFSCSFTSLCTCNPLLSRAHTYTKNRHKGKFVFSFSLYVKMLCVMLCCFSTCPRCAYDGVMCCSYAAPPSLCPE